MRAILGPERLYAHLGVAVISDGMEREAFELARELGIGLVLQGGAIEHHSHAWGFDRLLRDPETGDRRFAQWFQDGRLFDPGKQDDWSFGVRACSSRYAKAVYELRRQVELARAQRIAQSMREYPDTVLACSGPIECEMHQGDNRWGDYSPFTLAEFRDYLTHRGLYAPGAERAGMGYPGGERFGDDPSPAQAKGDHPSFNEVFGTRFTTWALRYWDPERFAQRVPLEAPGLPQVGQDGHTKGGFDAPRVWPGEKPTEDVQAEGNQVFWDAWASVDDASPGFRSKLINFWVRDHTRWLAEAGVPKDRIFSHQIPGESYGYGRLSRGATPVWTADTPDGSIGITTYFGAASDVSVFEKIVARNPNWGIFEYHPHPINALDAPISEYLHSLNTCIRFRAHILTPISWPGEGKDFIVKTGPFAEAIKQVLAELPDQPYYNRSFVDYAAPPVTLERADTVGDRVRFAWSSRIWPDLPYRWTDWRGFSHFQVRLPDGRVLATTRRCEVDVPVGALRKGWQVVAATRHARPKLPAITGLTGTRGRLRWDECSSFFCDHYVVQAYPSRTAQEPLVTLRPRQAGCELRLWAEATEVWCRVAASDAAGALGPFTELVRVSSPRPGRRLADLFSAHAVIQNSPDTAWREFTIAGETQPGLFQHPPLQGGGWASVQYRLKLPAVKPGQRIVFAADLALKEGAGVSDGVRFALETDTARRLEQLIQPDNRWHPVEVDLTDCAGADVLLTLLTHPSGSSAADWAVWGDPQVLLVGQGVAERPQVTGIVALGKEVRGRVTLRWQDKAGDGTLWSRTPGFVAFRVYRGADRQFAADSSSRLGETKQAEFVDTTFDGTQTFYRVTALFDDGTESPPSEAVQYAP